MRTQLVYRFGNSYLRAHAPSAEAAADESGPVVALLKPSYDEPGRVEEYLSFPTANTPTRLRKRRRPARHIPDSVVIGYRRFYFTRGRCKDVRVIHPEHVHHLDLIDAQIKELEKTRREMVEDAYARGRHLQLDDIYEGTAAYNATSARIRAGQE